MKIEKIGKIFDPRKYKLINNCHEFSQSPQTVVFDDFVRIYFSTREKDKNGKYLSHVTFVDMNKQFQVIEVAKKTVINLGKLGTFDEHGIFPINLLKEDNKILAYTTGWTRRVSVSVDAGIGHAVSYDNGLTFEKLGDGPILGASINEPFLVGDAFVKKYNDIYHMWYIHGTKWVTDNFSKNSERVYKIAHAVSNNGISWQKEGKNIIKDKLNIDECQALPSVIKINNIYHNKRVLVTGHTGFKGSWLCCWLKKLGADVTGYSLPPPTQPNHYECLNLDINSIINDIRDYKALISVFKEFKPEIIFHLAAQPSVLVSYMDPIETVSTNVIGTAHVLEASRRTNSVTAVVIVTTDKCYENKEWLYGYRENDELGGHDLYSASKACSEIVTDSYRRSFFSLKQSEYKGK